MFRSFFRSFLAAEDHDKIAKIRTDPSSFDD